MNSGFAWLLGLAGGVAAAALTAAKIDPTLHMAVCALVGLAFAGLAVAAHQKLRATGAPQSVIGSSAARHLALVWAWGAVALLVTYVAVIEQHWPEWWQFFLGFAVAALASLGFSSMLERDTAAGTSDVTIQKFGRVLLQAQVVGVVAALVTMFVDGKFPRAVVHADWAGCNIFFFGALAIIAISVDALRSPAPA